MDSSALVARRVNAIALAKVPALAQAQQISANHEPPSDGSETTAKT